MPLGAPIVAPADTWTFVDFPSTACDDGSPTGIGVYPSSLSTNVVVYLEGGGACWDYTTCAALDTSTHGPFGKAQFDAFTPPASGTVLGHADPANPFRTWSKVYVPYCTGDVHAGDQVNTYAALGATKTVHHKGHANVMAYLARLGATFPNATTVAVTGSSAGGGGAVFNYPSFRSYWPKASMMLVDDSLPLFEKDGISASERDSWFASWNLGPLSQPFCGDDCKTDLSVWMRKLAETYPNDRMALLSSLQDATIRTFFFTMPWDYETHLRSLATHVLDPTGHFRHFFVTGDTHTMLNAASSFSSQDVALWTWLDRMVSNDPSWQSLNP